MARRRVKIRAGRLLVSLILLTIIGVGSYAGISRAAAWMSRCSPVPETVPVSRSLSGLLLRDESRVYTQNSGKVTYFVQDGEKVQTGQKIAEIVVSGTVVTSQAPLASQGVLESNKQKKVQLELEISKLLEDISTGVNTGEIAGISSLKTDVNMKLAEKTQMENEITALENGYQPESAAAGSTVAKTGQVLEIRSPGNGIVSFYSDGLEETLKPALYRGIAVGASGGYTPAGFAVPEIQAGSLLYKLVDSSIWYLMIPISPTDRQVLGQSQGLDLRIGEVSFQAVVKDTLEKDGESVLMLESRGALPDFHKMRDVKVELIMDRYPGLAVPPSAVVENGQGYAVITVNGNNRKTRIPVQVVSKLPDRTIVAENSYYTGTGKSLKKIDTLTQKDYVLRSPSTKDISSSQTQE